MEKIKLTNEQKSKARKILSKYKTYASFIRNKEAAYSFTNIIGIKVCPYCNINYTYTITKGLIIRPDIDHFEPKSKYPEKQLELYNLVPSCQNCNERLKRDSNVTLKTNLNPYKDSFNSIMAFCVDIKNPNYLMEENFEIEFISKPKVSSKNVRRAQNNIELFKLAERYQFHKDVVVDIFKRINYYNNYKRKEISTILGEDFHFDNLLTVLFPEKNAEINNSSLGKLKKDVLERYL